MTDDEDVNIEILWTPQCSSSLKGYTLIDLVVHQHKDILYLKSSNDSLDFMGTLLGNEKTLKIFGSTLEEKSIELFTTMTTAL